MVLTPEREADRTIQNPIVDKLLSVLNIGEYEVRRAEFLGKGASITFVPDQPLDVKVPEGGPLNIKPSRLSKLFTFYFEVKPSYSLHLETENGFHESLRKIALCRNIALPNEVEATLQYQDVPFGLWHALPQNVKKNLSSFLITGETGLIKDLQVGWPLQLQGGPDRKRLDVSPSKYYSVARSQKEVLARKLAEKNIIRHMSKKNLDSDETQFVLKNGMDYKTLAALESALYQISGLEGFTYGLNLDLEFSGEFERRALVNVPHVFDGKRYGSSAPMLKKESQVRSPYFTLSPQRNNVGSIIKPCDLETAARMSHLFPGDFTTVSFHKKS